jgi:AcrR family transcriptional regulator
MPLELPMAGPSPALHERTDAARNRERILKVAGELVACRGIDHISMQEIAREAGVGPGTVYRRFGDRAGLALALLDHDTAALQDAMLRGPAPLGPGAPALERLCAFGVRYLELLDANAPLMLAAEPTAQDDPRGPYSMFLTHLAVLLREACPGLDPELTARVLLTGFNPRAHLQLRASGWTLDRLQDGWVALVARLAGR